MSKKKRLHQQQKKRLSHEQMGRVRIIGGSFRGRKLPVLSAQGLRPSSDRVRETLFNWLQFEIAGTVCLDAFAGSGALGLEALSRGAQSVTFMELNPQAVQQLKQNLQRLEIENAQVLLGEALQQLSNVNTVFDGIFLDPPFHQGLMQPAIDRIFQQQLIHPSGWLYLEQEKSLPWPKMAEGWKCVREKTTSQVKYGLFRQQD